MVKNNLEEKSINSLNTNKIHKVESVKYEKNLFGHLVKNHYFVYNDFPIIDLFDFFEEKKDLKAIAVIYENDKIEIISRKILYSALGKRYGRDIYYKKSVSKISEKTLCIDANLDILDNTNLFEKDLYDDEEHYYIILNNEFEKIEDKYYGIISSKDLLLYLSELTKKTIDKLHGDYYLTTLLLEPFKELKIKNDNIQVDSLLYQHKKFRFKNKDLQIGGDLNLVEEIYFNENKYLLFANIDAMGKSIQGAIGALLFGILFKNFTRKYKKSEHNFVEDQKKFLKLFYKEIQSIFEIFDCSMLVSAIVGLIDLNNDRLYFFNLEHPGLIISRNHKSFFVGETSKIGKKFGSPDNDDVHIQTFDLNPDDVIYCGTDGKDDVEYSKKGELVINDDEKLFLSIIDRAGNNIDLIFKILTEEYKLRDDLGILKIHYKENEKDDINGKNKAYYNINMEKLRKFIKKLDKKEKYEKAIKFLEKLLREKLDKDNKREIYEYLLEFYKKNNMINRMEELKKYMDKI